MRSYRADPLDDAVSAAERAEPVQLALLPPDGAAPSLPAVRGPGRPPGSRNRRTEAYAALLLARHGDPLEGMTQIASLNLLDRKTVEELSSRWGCTRFEAVTLAARIAGDVLSYLHQKMPTAITLNPGAPGGERIELEIVGDYADVTPEPSE